MHTETNPSFHFKIWQVHNPITSQHITTRKRHCKFAFYKRKIYVVLDILLNEVVKLDNKHVVNHKRQNVCANS